MTRGKVYLIGAGPGAPDLLSVRGRRVLGSADAILVDRLLPRNYLAELNIPTDDKHVEWLFEKQPPWPQEKINDWLASEARQGKTVVRLKGGDPFVFAQAEEETDYLSGCEIPWEAVPGPSSFTAVLTAAGFPLTRRRQGRSFAVATARLEGGPIFDRLPKADSLVVLMAIGALERIVDSLLAEGWEADTPAAVVERGACAWERRVRAPLSDLARTAREARVASPACVIVGDAATAVRACQGRSTVLFTGLDPTNFRDLGNLLHWPALEVAPDRPMRRLFARLCSAGLASRFEGLLFADKLGVAAFFEELRRQGQDARALAGIHIGAVGRATADRLGEHGLKADGVVGQSLPGESSDWQTRFAGKSVGIIEGTHPCRRIRESLELHGANVAHLTLNQVVPNRHLGRPLPDHDAIYFVSPAGVRAYAAAYGDAAFDKPAWCLGAETYGALAEVGVDAEILLPGPLLDSAVPASA